MSNEEIKDKVSEIHNWLPSAVGDLAEGLSVTGQSEGSADDLFEDPATLRDLISNQLNLSSPESQDVLLGLWEIEDGARKEACRGLLQSHFEFDPSE